MEPEFINLDKLRHGPIRNESLSLASLDQIRAVFEVIGPFTGMTLEEFEIGFMRDLHPECEIALWVRITKAWLAYHEDFLANSALPLEQEKTLLIALIAISAGIEAPAKLNVSVEVGRELVRCYQDPAGG